MPTSRDLIKNVNDQTLEQVRRSQDAVVDAVRTLSARAPRLPGSIDVPIDMPIDADRLIDAAFGFAQSALDLNHRFAHKLLALTGVGAAAAPAPSVVAEPAPKVTVTRPAAKKTVAAQPAATKPAATKPAATKPATRKATAEKAAVKKAAVKKATTKRAPAKRA